MIDLLTFSNRFKNLRWGVTLTAISIIHKKISSVQIPCKTDPDKAIPKIHFIYHCLHRGNIWALIVLWILNVSAESSANKWLVADSEIWTRDFSYQVFSLYLFSKQKTKTNKKLCLDKSQYINFKGEFILLSLWWRITHMVFWKKMQDTWFQSLGGKCDRFMHSLCQFIVPSVLFCRGEFLNRLLSSDHSSAGDNLLGQSWISSHNREQHRERLDDVRLKFILCNISYDNWIKLPHTSGKNIHKFLPLYSGSQSIISVLLDQYQDVDRTTDTPEWLELGCSLNMWI